MLMSEHVPPWLPIVDEMLADPQRLAARDLETYLRALLGLIFSRPISGLSISDLNGLLRDSLVAPPIQFHESWNSITKKDAAYAWGGTPKSVAEEIEAVTTLIKGQVADLRWFDANPPILKHPKWPVFDNEQAPRGIWANGNALAMFLESGAAGCCGHKFEARDTAQDGRNWWLLRRFLILGQVYE